MDSLPEFADLDPSAFGLYVTWLLSERITVYNVQLNKAELQFSWIMTGKMWHVGDRAQDKMFRKGLVNHMIELARFNVRSWPGLEVLQHLSRGHCRDLQGLYKADGRHLDEVLELGP